MTLREDIADLLTRLDDTEATTQALPHRRKYLLLVTGFLRRLLQLHLELVDEVERELGSSGSGNDSMGYSRRPVDAADP